MSGPKPEPCAPVAQLDRAFGYEPKGREFESLRAHHLDQQTTRFPIKAKALRQLNWCTIAGFRTLPPCANLFPPEIL